MSMLFPPPLPVRVILGHPAQVSPIFIDCQGNHKIRGILIPVPGRGLPRSEEHTSELQSHSDLVCRLLLEKKKQTAILRAFEQIYPHLLRLHASFVLALSEYV